MANKKFYRDNSLMYRKHLTEAYELIGLNEMQRRHLERILEKIVENERAEVAAQEV